MAHGDTSQKPAGGRLAFIGAAGGACVANVTWWMQPLLMHELAIGRGLGEASAGWLVSVEMACLAGASALAARLAGRANLLTLGALGMGAAILASVLTLFTSDYALLMALRAIAGAGMGVLLMTSNSVASASTDPDRAFAGLGVVNLIFGSALVGSVALVRSVVAESTPYLTMLLALIALIVAVAFLPRRPADHGADAPLATAMTQGAGLRVALLVGVTFLIGVSSGVMWAFYALIGETTGLSIEQIDAAISLAILVSIAGAALPAILGARFGRVAPISFGILLLASAIAALAFSPSQMLFRIAICVNLSAIYMVLPYLLGTASAVDPSGRAASYVNSAFFFTGAVSPALGGMLAATVGIQVVGFAVIGVALAAIVASAYAASAPPAVASERSA